MRHQNDFLNNFFKDQKSFWKMYKFTQVRHVYVEQVVHYKKTCFLFKGAKFAENKF